MRRSALQKEAEEQFGKDALDTDTDLQPVRDALNNTKVKLSDVKGIIDSAVSAREAKSETAAKPKSETAAKPKSDPIVSGLKGLLAETKAQKRAAALNRSAIGALVLGVAANKDLFRVL